MKTFQEIRTEAENGAEFYAIGDNGEKYPATFSAEYMGGIMFFCIPADVQILDILKNKAETPAMASGDWWLIPRR